MRTIIFLTILACATNALAQKESFDLASYVPPKTWEKKISDKSVQFIKDDAKNGYCIISLLKAMQGTTDSKENFNMAWETLVKENITVTAAPEMLAPAAENGWEVQSGYAAFDKEGEKGAVVLVTSTGFEKMVNILILTNSDKYEKNISEFLESVSLTKPEQPAIEQPKIGEIKEKAKTTAINTGFTFTTTNFDDGWTSVVKEDWVQATKGAAIVLIHYPNKQADEYNTSLIDGLKNAWNVLVAPRYSSASNLEFKPIYSWQSIEFAEADAVEKETGNTVHVVLFKKNYSGGNGRYLEFINPDKKSFEEVFGQYHQTYDGWEKMEAMVNYNKFAIAASDLAGNWTSDFSGTTQYVNSYTGMDAGMDTHASSENFHIGPGNSYKWDLAVASGFVGNIKFQGVKSSGKFSLIGNWQVKFSDIEGKPRTYNASFTCIKGLRILWLGDKAFAKKD